MGLLIDTSALVALERQEGGWDGALEALGDERAVGPEDEAHFRRVAGLRVEVLPD